MQIPDPREPFFYQDCLHVDNQDVEEILKELAPCNLSLSNHQPLKIQKQCHRNKLVTPNKLAKYQQSKKGEKMNKTNRKMLKERKRPKPSLEQYPHHPKNSTSLPHPQLTGTAIIYAKIHNPARFQPPPWPWARNESDFLEKYVFLLFQVHSQLQ
jgi:hypothetical protein